MVMQLLETVRLCASSASKRTLVSRGLVAFGLFAFLTAPACGTLLPQRALVFQDDVERLAAELIAQNTSELNGDLVITHNVTDLRPLRGHLRELSGALVITTASWLPNLDGLEDLVTVGRGSDGESLVIGMCARLVSVTGLAGLRGPLSGSLVVFMLSSLGTLSGLERITSLGVDSAGRSLDINAVDRLQTLAGLSGLVGRLPGSLTLRRNPSLEHLEGLSGIRSLAAIRLENNPSLQTVRHLRGLRGALPGGLQIEEHNALTSLDGLEGISSITGGGINSSSLVLRKNYALLSLGGLRGVSGELPKGFIIEANLRLKTLSGLQGVTSLGPGKDGYCLQVVGNTALRSLASLGGLSGHWQCNLLVSENRALRSLHGLERIASVGSASGPTRYVLLQSNYDLRSVAALGNLRQVTVTVQNNVRLQSFQGLFQAQWLNLQGQVACLTPEGSERTMHGPFGVLASFPSALCHRCPYSCGEGPYECAYDIGQCRCPLQQTGPGCAANASRVHVELPPQPLRCKRARLGAGLPAAVLCNLRIPLRRDHAVNITGGGATNLVLEVLRGSAVEGLNVSESRVEWEAETHGSLVASISVPGGRPLFEPDASVALRVGYGPKGQPDCLLHGTLTDPRNPNAPVYPWCLDGGTCSQFAPVEIPLLIEGRQAHCRPWAYAVRNEEACIPCPSGAVAVRKVIDWGEAACQSCGSWQVPLEGRDECGLPLGFWAWLLAALCTLAAGLFLALVQLELAAGPRLRGRSIPIEDISSEDGQVVLSTCGPHGLNRWLGGAFCVTVQGTGQQRLDKADESLRAQVLGKDRLLLLDAGKTPLQGRLDASMGSIYLEPRGVALHAGWPLPVSLLAPLLVALGVAGLVTVVQHREEIDDGADAETQALAATAPLVALLLALAGRLWVRGKRTWSQLQKRVALYSELLRRDSLEPQRRDRGPGRAIRTEQLIGLLDFFRALIRDRSMHYVVHHIVKPLTAAEAVSFAEFVGPSEVRWFVSHYWGTAFQNFCASIQKHAEAVGGADWRDERYWICSLSNNQHRVSEEMGKDLNSSSFYLALCSGCCRGTCMVLDEDVTPLKRSWCLFELLQTIRMEAEGTAGFGGLLFCTEAGVLNYGKGTLSRSMKVAGVLAELSLECATASDPHDKAMIDAQVVDTMGGFEAMDAALRTRVEAVVGVAETSATAEFASLRKRLRGSQS